MAGDQGRLSPLKPMTQPPLISIPPVPFPPFLSFTFHSLYLPSPFDSPFRIPLPKIQ